MIWQIIISRGQIREFENLAKIIFSVALLRKTENSRILNFVKSPKIRNSRKSPDLQQNEVSAS